MVVVVAVKSSSSRSGDSFSRFFSAPLREPTRTKEHTKLLVFYSSLSSLLMSVRQTTARTERNDGTDCSSTAASFTTRFWWRFSTVLVHFCRSLPDYSGRTLLRGAFLLRFKFPIHETSEAWRITGNRVLKNSKQIPAQEKDTEQGRFSTATVATTRWLVRNKK